MRKAVLAITLVAMGLLALPVIDHLKAEAAARERQAKREQIMADFNRCAGATMDQLWQDGPVKECS